MTTAFLGMIFNVGFQFAPRNYATCDGQLLPVNQNQALFSLLGITYGGNGQTTFALPNLQGRNAIHRGQSSGTSNYVQGSQGGTEGVSLTTANMAQHTHAASYSNSGGSTLTAYYSKGTTNVPDAGLFLSRAVDGDSTPNAFPYIYKPAAATDQVNISSVNVAGTPTIANVGSGIPLNIVKPYNTILSIIATQGLFPTRN